MNPLPAPAFRFALWLLLLVAPCSSFATPPAQEMADAAQAFVSGLDSAQKAKALIEFSSNERFNWDFVPKSRRGIPLKELKPEQQELARTLLRTGLSAQGYTKATNIIYVIEQVLREMENQAAWRDSGLYYVTIFGDPQKSPWGWRVEGHHLSVNFTVSSNEVLAVSPSFFGSNPAEVPRGPHKGLRVLGAEEDLGRELISALSDQQRKLAIFSATAPREIITGNARQAKRLDPLGISARDFTDSQKELLRKLIREYLFRFRTEVAETDFKKIEAAGFENISFAWAGPVERGHGHYYRVQGPTFLLEYDNTQNRANHIHTVWRDLENDFGEDLLKKHYEQSSHGHGHEH